jgi:hypothetical protein
MDAQLRLIPRLTTPGDGPATPRTRPPRSGPERAEAPLQWRIDDTARERGRAGLSRAREVLRQARRPLPGEHHTTAA